MKNLLIALLLLALPLEAQAGGFPMLMSGAKKYTITSSAGTNGTITASATVKAHKSKTFTILGSAGYLIDALTIDGVGVDTAATKTFTNVTANHTISATFKQAGYTITVSAGAHGTITPGTTVVPPNGSQAFSIAGASGYSVDSVYIDGVYVDSVTTNGGTYLFSNVTATHTISSVNTVNLIDFSPAVLNGGFETLGANPPVYGSWTQYVDGNTHLRDTSDAHSGSHAAVLYGGNNICVIYQNVFTEGKLYRVKLWAKANASCTLNIGYWLNGYTQCVLTTDWQQFSATVTMTGTSLVILNSNQTGKNMVVDDVRIFCLNP